MKSLTAKEKEKLISIRARETLDAFDGGNRIVKGQQYQIERVLEDDSEQINGDIERPAVILKSKAAYPYAFKFSRFTIFSK